VEAALENRSARKVAEHVDLLNVIPILITAERMNARFSRNVVTNSSAEFRRRVGVWSKE
jgi:hypothetical protein